ncbi:MAG: pantoate--beta-alanine ligase [Verrucomicrobiota bacterium]
MKTVESSAAMQRQSALWVKSGETVGFVPTMGALHAGHLVLIRRARKECARVVVSIYVNPTQFGPKEDLARYPRPRARDLALCREAGADLVFAPRDLYAPDHSTWVEEVARSQGRDGASRPGHFPRRGNRGAEAVQPRAADARLLRPEGRAAGGRDRADGA